ncbi:SCO3374 family protein [Streptomyces beihaiensis]|uniref:SCO3374 family protein n=1 Tax=Streptomyces beihaiensis TaxID=2984495 RepID=A0ABT3TN06_9ACTN|nr:SCO3374 family protein [Streptomyces beihaiensis]MCX3058428.1 SCO3374 family protein [Streptomyces beihaiensis]
MVPTTGTTLSASFPAPRRPLEAAGDVTGPDPVRQWYERELGWAVRRGPDGPLLPTGLGFDVLELPADAGFGMLRRLDPRSPVALSGETMQLLVAAGSADELPGLLEWLEWGSLPQDLVAVGAGGSIGAPTPPGMTGPQEAAVWVRPPEPGRETEPVLAELRSPTAAPTGPAASAASAWSAAGGGGGAPDLVRLVDMAATQCHRARLRRACAQRSTSSGRTSGQASTGQPLAFSYSSRIVAGTRPRSLTS